MPDNDPDSRRLVVFTLAERRYAVDLEIVERVLPTLEATPLPGGPEIVSGLINLQGRLIPLLDIRRRFRLAEREPELSDHVLVARITERTVALQVDRVEGLEEIPAEAVVPGREIVPGMEYVRGVVKLASGLLLIHDLETFLSLEEEQALDRALARLPE